MADKNLDGFMLIFIKSVLTTLLFVYFCFELEYIIASCSENYRYASQLLQRENSVPKFFEKRAVVALVKNDSNVLQQMIDDGWKIVLTSDEVDYLVSKNSAQSKNGYAGVTIFTTKTILLEGDGAQSVINHEVGHVIDFFYGRVSVYNEDFLEIYKKEKHTVGEYAQQNSTEYFAESYSRLVNNRSDIGEETKAYISILLDISRQSTDYIV